MSEENDACSSCSDSGCPARQTVEGESKAQQQDRQQLQSRLCSINNRLMVMSGKGGVGKSSTAVNLAVALAEQGKRVGLLDVDIHGPSIPKMLGLDDFRPEVDEVEGIYPAIYRGIKVMSIGFMLRRDEDAMIWRGAMKASVIRQFICDVAWGELDYLVVDCPPGTGDEPLSVTQLLGESTAAVVVTTPQEVALLDVRKSITFCRQLKMNLLGVIENMSGFACPHCGEAIDLFKGGGGQALADDMGVGFLGAVPGDPEMVKCGDRGTPYIVACPDTATAVAIRRIGEKIDSSCRQPAS